MNKLVIFYSLGGTTRFIAEAIASEVGADILELKPKEDRKLAGLMKYYWRGRQVFMKEGPELFSLDKDPNKYDILFIGTPVWAFTYSPPLRTFFENFKPQKKKVALFCTHGGIKLNVFKHMEEALSGNQIISEKDFLTPTRGFLKSAAKNAKGWARKVISSI